MADSRVLSDNARAWLLTVARNHCLDLLRRRKRFGNALTTMGGGLQTTGDPEAAVIDHDSLGSLLESLTPRERIALWQSAVEHRPLADIADRLKLNYMAAAQVLSRARRHAATVAARVAMVFGIPALYRSLRAARGVGIPSYVIQAAQIAAVVAVPVLLISVQSSTAAGQQRPPASIVSTPRSPSSAGTSATGSGATHSSTTGRSLVAPSVNPGLPGISPPIQVPASPVAVPSAVSSTVNGVTKIVPTVSPKLPPIPSAPPLPSAAPLPSVVPLPSALPTPTALPVPHSSG